jgi:hypothetical protein
MIAKPSLRVADGTRAHERRCGHQIRRETAVLLDGLLLRRAHIFGFVVIISFRIRMQPLKHGPIFRSFGFLGRRLRCSYGAVVIRIFNWQLHGRATNQGVTTQIYFCKILLMTNTERCKQLKITCLRYGPRLQRANRLKLKCHITHCEHSSNHHHIHTFVVNRHFWTSVINSLS